MSKKRVESKPFPQKIKGSVIFGGKKTEIGSLKPTGGKDVSIIISKLKKAAKDSIFPSHFLNENYE